MGRSRSASIWRTPPSATRSPPTDAGECLFPYPNDYYTTADSGTDTGKRLALAPDSTPVNNHDVHVDPTEINTSDGFSPGAPVVTQVPGLDTPEAFANTDSVPVTEMAHYLDREHADRRDRRRHRQTAADLDRARLDRIEPG